MDFFSKLSLSDKKYAKHIEVQPYLITKDQVADLFRQENGDVTQKANQELYGREVFLLVRCKNNGESPAFGTLKIKIENMNTKMTVNINDLSGNSKSFHDCIIFIGSGFVPNDDNFVSITYYWEELYTM